MNLYIESDKLEYDLGEVARFTVTLQFDEPVGSVDVWMAPSVWLLDDDGNMAAEDRYPHYAMHESDEEDREVGWFVHPIHRGRWGMFRAQAVVYEPERHEVGTVHTDFKVNGPDQP
jgi:hypothetical protein